ncbi:MAG: glutaredoxin 3 [Alphaproteobacteria bacterium]
MPPVEIFTTPFCGYCHMAKRLLKGKGIAFAETDVSRDPAQRAVMMQRSGGRRSVPQIFIGQTHVGGCDELYSLERGGKLDSLLTARVMHT